MSLLKAFVCQVILLGTYKLFLEHIFEDYLVPDELTRNCLVGFVCLLCFGIQLYTEKVEEQTGRAEPSKTKSDRRTSADTADTFSEFLDARTAHMMRTLDEAMQHMGQMPMSDGYVQNVIFAAAGPGAAVIEQTFVSQPDVVVMEEIHLTKLGDAIYANEKSDIFANEPLVIPVKVKETEEKQGEVEEEETETKSDVCEEEEEDVVTVIDASKEKAANEKAKPEATESEEEEEEEESITADNKNDPKTVDKKPLKSFLREVEDEDEEEEEEVSETEKESAIADDNKDNKTVDKKPLKRLLREVEVEDEEEEEEESETEKESAIAENNKDPKTVDKKPLKRLLREAEVEDEEEEEEEESEEEQDEGKQKAAKLTKKS